MLYITTCRAFEMPTGDFDLELLHNLAQARTYVGLRELTAISGEEDKVFRIKEEVDVFLFIRTHRSNFFSKPLRTEIEMTMRSSSTNRSEWNCSEGNCFKGNWHEHVKSHGDAVL